MPKKVEKKKVTPKKTISKKAVEKEKQVEEVVGEEVTDDGLETVVVCRDENGENGKEVTGYVNMNKKSVTTLDGVTYAL